MKTTLSILAALCSLSIASPIHAETATSLSKAEQEIFNQAFDAGAVATACQYFADGDINATAYRGMIRKIVTDGYSDPQALLAVMNAGNDQDVAGMQPCATEFKAVLNEK